MLKDILPKKTMELTCNAGHKVKKSLAWLKDHSEIACPSCGGRILLDRNQLVSAIKSCEKAEANLLRTIDEINKSLKIRR